MDKSTILSELVEAKSRRRAELARLPYPDKVRIVVELQKMQAPILAARGIRVMVWELDRE